MNAVRGRIRAVVMLACAVLLLAPSYAPDAVAQQLPEIIPGQYIIVFQDWVQNPVAEARILAAQHGLGVLHAYQHALKGFSAVVPAGRLDALQSDARIAFINEDRVVSIAAVAQSNGQTLPTGVDRIEGDLSSTQSGNGSQSVDVAVAVIDTGIDTKHPDLNVAGGVNCSSGNSFNDGNGHGTHVAGTIGAIGNGIGVVGMAPGARLYAVRVLNNAGWGTWESVICGVDWVTANAAAPPDGLGIKVANMSLGGSGSDNGTCATTNDAFHLAICNSVNTGVTYVVAAGNSTADYKGFVPAAYDEVLTVTAVADFNGLSGGGAAPTCRTDIDDTAADFSNFARAGSPDEGHTIAAPGVCILSAWKGGGYNTISGTSMASPHVAGTAALCIATGNCPGTSSQVISKLRDDARLKTNAAGQPLYYGFGGDPNSPITSRSGRTGWITRYYGYLVHAGGY